MESPGSVTNVPPQFYPCHRQPRCFVSILRRSAPLPTSSASSTTREHSLFIGIPVAVVPSDIPSQTEGYPSLQAIRGLRAVNQGCDVSTADPGFDGASVPSSMTFTSTRLAHSASGSTSTARVVTSEQRSQNTSCFYSYPRHDAQRDDCVLHQVLSPATAVVLAVCAGAQAQGKRLRSPPQAFVRLIIFLDPGDLNLHCASLPVSEVPTPSVSLSVSQRSFDPPPHQCSVRLARH